MIGNYHAAKIGSMKGTPAERIASMNVVNARKNTQRTREKVERMKKKSQSYDFSDRQ